jgi:2-oxoglutarate dehydrogenase E2 component (dihydrolipoamide succinyltransferase)
MPIEITAPTFGESIIEATVGQWRKREGDSVAAGEPLVELETDKVNIEVVAPEDGVLAAILKGEGETIGVGDTLARLEPASVAATTPVAQVATASVAEPDAANGAGAGVTPLARRIAASRHVDLQAVSGTGAGGKITQDDVESYLKGQPTAMPAAVAAQPAPAPVRAVASVIPAAPQVVDAQREERVRMSRRRQTIAKRLVEAQHTAAMLTTFNEIDMSAVMAMRKRRRDVFKERYGVSLGYMSFFTKAVVGALKAFPRLNAEIQGDEMVLKRYYDIGIAVGVEEGLVVPVLRDTDRLSFAEIERQIAVYADKARKNQLSLEEIRGGTFTVSNGGTFGSLLSTPILNGPQVGILGMHKIQERPIALNGEVVIHPMMYVALSYDHRIVDGNEAVRFLVRIKELVEDPESLLIDG